MPAVVYELDSGDVAELKKLLEYDPYLDKSLGEDALKRLHDDKLANVIFTRQEYSLRDGAALGFDSGKNYLYLKANDDFLKLADEKLKNAVKSIKKAGKDYEDKFIALVEDEQNRGNAGIGAIFGG